MNKIVKEVFDDVSEYLKDNIEHQNKQIDYIIIDLYIILFYFG